MEKEINLKKRESLKKRIFIFLGLIGSFIIPLSALKLKDSDDLNEKIIKDENGKIIKITNKYGEFNF